MNIAIVYDSSTGTTAKAAEAMGQLMEEQGLHCQVQSITEADPAKIAAADLICVGCWVKGLFIIRQHPTSGIMRFIERLGNLNGKRTVVFCTFKIAIGSTLHKMAEALEGNGAEVAGQFKFRGPEPNNKFASFVTSLN